MLYIRIEAGFPVEVSAEYPGKGQKEITWARRADGSWGSGWFSRNDIKSFAFARTMAELLTEKFGKRYLPCQRGSSEFDVIEAPVVGNEVSKGFNGDYYPCGKIVKITPTFQITTSDGTKFRRVKESAGWREVGRGFWMVAGVHDERNPSF